jgi:hypothetical protein
MQSAKRATDTGRLGERSYASMRFRWEIDRDVVRGRAVDVTRKLLPDGLSLVGRLEFLDAGERRLMSQVQGWTYVRMLGLMERIIGAKIPDLAREHARTDRLASTHLPRLPDDERKHEELFARIDRLLGEAMPNGYRFVGQSDLATSFVSGKSTWAALALVCLIGLITQVHYRQTIEPDRELSDLYKDVLFFHWMEESQFAVVDELRWLRESTKLNAAERDAGLDQLIEILQGIDAILFFQAPEDAGYFARTCKRRFSPTEFERLERGMLDAYRWQYIRCGLEEPRFAELLSRTLNCAQVARMGRELGPVAALRRAGTPCNLTGEALVGAY